MANREPPYDPYIPAGGAGAGGSAQYEGGNPRTAAIQSVGAVFSISADMEQHPVFFQMGLVSMSGAGGGQGDSAPSARFATLSSTSRRAFNPDQHMTRYGRMERDGKAFNTSRSFQPQQLPSISNHALPKILS